MIHLNCWLSSPDKVGYARVSVNLTFDMKVGGTDKEDMEDSINEYINDHILPEDVNRDNYDVNTKIEWDDSNFT